MEVTWSIHSFIHSLNGNLLGTFCVAGNILGIDDVALDRAHKQTRKH